MVEPGTAAIAALSTIAGISGYGAMKVNAKQSELMEAEIAKRVQDVNARLTASEQAKRTAEEELARQQTEVARLTAELETLRAAQSAAAAAAPPPAAEATPPPAAEESEETDATRPVGEEERARCQALLEQNGIRTLRDWRRWMVRNQDSPDLAAINNCADIVLKNRTGGKVRKSTLKNRRKTIQNGRRTRRSKNRANRTHSYTR